MNVYVKCFEIPDRLRASLNPDECEVLEVDGVPFIDEYGVFSPLDGLRIDPSGRYLLFCESGIDSLVGIDLMSHHVIELLPNLIILKVITCNRTEFRSNLLTANLISTTVYCI